MDSTVRQSAHIKETDLSAALSKFQSLLGSENVILSNEGLVKYRDKHAPDFGEKGEFFPTAALRPITVEEIQEILRIANRYTIPLKYFSRGRNFGYGGPNAVLNFAVTLDLSRMTKILEINTKYGYIVVEPGVSLEMVRNELIKRGLDGDWWLDGASNPYGSIIGNAMDRGVGYGLKGDRTAVVNGMEVVLPDSTVMRTGMWAMSKSKAAHQYKYGYGPNYDMMFQQSNFGIVTKAGFEIIKAPPCIRAAEVYTKSFEGVVPFIDTLRELQLERIVDMAASGSFNFGGISPHSKGPWGGWFPPEPGMHPAWRCRIGFYGDERVVDAKWERALAAFEKALGDDCFYDERKYSKPYDYTNWQSEDLLAAGVATDLEVDVWDHYGTFTSVVLPYNGQEVMKMIQLVGKEFEKYGLKYFGSPFHIHTGRALIFLIAVPMGGENFPAPVASFTNDKAVELTWKVIKVCEENGWGKYRSSVDYQYHGALAYDFNDNALLRFSEQIKDAIDPNGILSPGKYGIWPKRIRENS